MHQMKAEAVKSKGAQRHAFPDELAPVRRSALPTLRMLVYECPLYQAEVEDLGRCSDPEVLLVVDRCARLVRSLPLELDSSSTELVLHLQLDLVDPAEEADLVRGQVLVK